MLIKKRRNIKKIVKYDPDDEEPIKVKVPKKKPVRKKIKEEPKETVTAEDLDTYNPWLVGHVSDFLKYCCPECKFSDSTLKGFTEHALERHNNKAKCFFTAQNISEQFRQDRVIKPEDPGYFEFENYDFESNIFTQDIHDHHDQPYDDNEETGDEKPKKTDLEPKKKRVRKNVWKSLVVTSEKDFEVEGVRFESKVDATKHFIDKHMEAEKFEACQFCVEVFATGDRLRQHHMKTHPKIEKYLYNCKICTEYPPTISFMAIMEHYKKEHADRKDLKPYQCLNCEESFNFYEEILKHEKDVHKIAHVEAKCESCPQTFLSEQFHVIHKYSHDQAGEPPPIWCNFCEFTCTDQTALEVHLDKEHQDQLPKFLCEMCVVEFPTKEDMKSHKLEKHTTQLTNRGRMYTCSLCDFKTTDANWNKLLYHIDSRHPEHGEKRFACSNCNKAFIYEASTRIHRTQRKCGVNIEKHPHVCELCGSNFGHKSKLNEHMLLKHSNSDDKTKLVCEKCGFSTVSKHKLRDHIRAKHEVEKHRKCPYCDYRSEQKQKIHFHIDIKHPESGQKNFFCDKCQMGFIYQQTCTHHMKFKCKHSGYVRPGETRQKLGLTCGYCDAVFNSDYRAKIHYKAKHPGKPILAKGFKKYNCAYCTDFFFTEESLNCHLNLTHGLKTEKNFCKKCKQPYTETHDACPRDYKNPNKIQEKFVCTQCNGTYSSKQYLREHIETIHEGKRYGCSYEGCEQTYATTVHLKSHIQIVHMKCQDFECEHCGKKFGALVRLRNHVRQSHTQILCGLCHKQVNNRHELKRHMALEHNETKDAFVCEICPKKVFFNRLAFQKHIENKH